MSPRTVFIEAAYLAASVLFILGLRSLTVPDRARRGMQLAALGMLVAIVGTLVHHEIVRYDWILAGPRARRDHRLPARRVRADDGDAAADRDLAHVRRDRGDARRRRRVLAPRPRRARSRAARWRRSGSRCSSARSPSPAASWRSGSCRSCSPRGRSPSAARTSSPSAIFGAAVGALRLARRRARRTRAAFYAMVGARARLRRLARPPHRRRGHAGRHLAPQLVRGPRLRGDRLRDRQQRPHHRRRARRRVGLHPLDHHEPGDEPLVHERALRRVRRGAGGVGADRPRGSPSTPSRPRTPPSSSPARGSSSWCPGYGMAVAQAQHQVRELADARREERRDGAVRHPPGRRPHARAHERAARRGERPLRQAEGDGRDQRRVQERRRGARHRRERRREPGRAHRPGARPSTACRS